MTEADPPCTGQLPETATVFSVILLCHSGVGDICLHASEKVEVVDFYKDKS